MRGLVLVVMLLTAVLARAQPAPTTAPTPPSSSPAPAKTTAESDADLELARAHFKTGELYYERGRFPDAAREFEEAYRLSHKPEMLFNMGKSYDGVGDYARALAAYRRWLAEVPNGSDRGMVETRVQSMERLVGRIVVRCSVDGSALLLDGKDAGTTPIAEPIEVNPGAHAITVTHEGYRTFRKQLVASPGLAVDVNADLESLVKVQVVEVVRKEKAQPIYKRWWLWTAVGVVVAAGAITAGVLASQAPPVTGNFAALPEVK